MIETIRIRNFKCFEDQTLRLAPFTLLSGPNAAGKSSVLQALLLLRQSYQQGFLATEGLVLNGDLVQLGTAGDVLFEGAGDPIFGFSLSLEDKILASWYFQYDHPADIVRPYSFSSDLGSLDRTLFGNDFQYMSAERIGPRTYSPASEYWVKDRRQLGPRGEYAAHFLSLFGTETHVLDGLLHPSESNSLLIPQLEAWMGEISPGVRIQPGFYPSLDLASLQYSFVQERGVTNPYRPTHVGFGLSYTLPVILAVLMSAPGTLLLIENPEAHLHPKGQVRLGELLARAAASGIQTIVESHSDHLLNGLRIAVRDGILQPDDAQIHFLNRSTSATDMSSRVISPKVDRDGRLDKWPEGFFDEWEKSLERLI